MADNVVVTAGTGTTIAADELTDGTLGSVKVQYVKLMDGTLDGSTKAAVGAAGLKVDGSGATQPISAASLPLPTGAATAAKQPALGTAGSASSDVITIQGVASMTKLLVTPDLPTGASTAAKQPALGTAGTASSDVITVQGITSMTPLKVDGSGVTQPVSGTVTANAGTNLNTSLLALESGGNLATLAGAVTSSIVQENVAKINNVTPLMGNGVTGTGSQRVTIASDNTAFSVNAVESGTWTVQPGNTPNTSPWLVTQIPKTSGGWTMFHLASAGSTNATNIKASAGQVGGWYIYNSNAAARKVAFHNTAGTPTAGASVFFSLVIPPTSAANVEFNNGIPFSTGIAISTVTGLADSDATAVAANDLIINILYI